MTSSAASTTYAAQLLRVRTPGNPSKLLRLTAACSDPGRTTGSCDRSSKTTRSSFTTTTTLQSRCAHPALRCARCMSSTAALLHDPACMRPAPDADGCGWVHHRDTAAGAAAGPSSVGVSHRTDEVDRLRAENVRLRDMLRQLANADISPELVAAARVCIASARCCCLCCPLFRPR